MRESVWSWLGAKSGTSEEVRTRGSLSLETLEPRLLLSADPIGLQSLTPLETPLTSPAIVADLPGADEGQLESSSPILTIDVLAVDRSGDTGTTGLDGFLADNDPDDCADELTDNVLGADAGDRPVDENMTAFWAAALGQRGCDVVTVVKPSALPIALQNGSAGPAVPGQQDTIPDPKALPIEIRGPPVAGSDSLSAISLDSYSTESNSYEVTAGHNSPVFVGFVAQGMQALPLTDLDISNWQGQIIYLDFDGEHWIKYSTAGGDDSTFVSSLGMAEQMDGGTSDLMDAAHAVTGQVARSAADTSYLGRLADMIAADAGCLAESLGSDGIEHGSPAPPSAAAVFLYDGGDSFLSSPDQFNWDGDIAPRAPDVVIGFRGGDLATICGGTSGAHVVGNVVSGDAFMLSVGGPAAFGEVRGFGFSFCAPLASPPRSLPLAPIGLSQNFLGRQLDKAGDAAHFVPIYRLGNVGENPKTFDKEAVPCL